MYIPGELKEKYSLLKGFELKEQNKDYIYRTKDIIELKGKKYKDKRNKRNFFINNYNFKVKEYSPEKHKKGCIDLLSRWKNQKQVKREDLEKLKADVNANRKVLEIGYNLDVRGMVVLVDDKVEGYIFGEQTNEQICTLFFGKSNLEIKGLSQFIYGEFLNRFFGNCKLVNDGEDWDVKYLEHSKMSYNPHMTKKSYMLEKV